MEDKDFADDAFWRAYWYGYDQAVTALCRQINQICDGKNKCTGSCSEPWQSTRRRILDFVEEASPKFNWKGEPVPHDDIEG